MARSSQARRSARLRGLNLPERDPADPLRHARHEAFAKAFALNTNAKAAAIEAGYARHIAIRAAGRLLSVKAMSARIRHLQSKDADGLTITRLVQELHYQPKAAVTKAIARNPFTGETSFDLGRLSAPEIASLEFTNCDRVGPSAQSSGIKVHSRPGKALGALGGLVRDPAYAPNRKEKETIAEALADIARRNVSAAPLHRAKSRSEDEN